MPTEEARINTTSGTRLSLEVDLGVEPIRGTLHASGAAAIAFTGWLGLIGALESLRTGQSTPMAEGER